MPTPVFRNPATAIGSSNRALIKGAAVLVGEIALGVNGPFLFARFGLNVPVAAAIAVIFGAATGYTLVSLALWASDKDPAVARIFRGSSPADARSFEGSNSLLKN